MDNFLQGAQLSSLQYRAHFSSHIVYLTLFRPLSVTSLQSKANSPILSGNRAICSLNRGLLTFECDLCSPGILSALDN